jgi:hypothetical protein
MAQSEKTRLLYFTVVPMARADNGGSIVCRYHVQRLAACEGIDLHVCTFGAEGRMRDEGEFLRQIGVAYHPIHGGAPTAVSKFKKKLRKLQKKYSPSHRLPFMLEAEAMYNTAADNQFCALLKLLSPDIVVIDYLYSALFIKSVFSMPVRIITITLNREAEFHAEMRRLGKLDPNTSTSFLAQWRLSRFENAVYRNSDAVVALSRNDLPTTNKNTAVLAPILDAPPRRWNCSGNRRMFFVGNIQHYPNFLAMKWLAEQFAPALALRDRNCRISIVGATKDQVPQSWLLENIDYKGFCDQESLDHLFRTSLFVAPIENDFGAKLKVAQCVAYGTPLLATEGALSGIPFREHVPQFSLADPTTAVNLAVELVIDSSRLTVLSDVLTREHQRALDLRNESWLQLVNRVKVQPIRQRELPFFSPLRKKHKSDDVDLSRPWPKQLEIAIGYPTGLTTKGVFAVERFKGDPLRWTGETAEFALPLNRNTLPKRLTIQLWGMSPPNGADICVSVNDVEMFRDRVMGRPTRHSIRLPDLSDAGHMSLRLESSGFQPDNEDRKLGVAIRSIVLSR